MKKILIIIIGIVCFCNASQAQENPSVSGVYPKLAMVAGHSPRTEGGTGAMMPWANRLWLVTYVAHTSWSGTGTGLYEINEDMEMKKHPKSVVGTYANRLVHGPTNQLLIGPYVIDTLGKVTVIEGLVKHRLAATMLHLTDRNKVYYLAMEGEFLEVDVTTYETKILYDLKKELNEPKGSKPHFKSGFTQHGRVVVTNNSYSQKDFDGTWSAGRLAEWDGEKWTILSETAFTEVWGGSFDKPMIATGWDKASVLMHVYYHKIDEWKVYRLPKGSRTFDQTSCTEWMRIREVETERALMDCHGLFYEIGNHTYPNELWAIKPISSHLRMVPDFCSWRGMLVLGGNQATPMRFKSGFDNNPLAGQVQAGLWFGKTDDLWNFGKLQGEGGVWLDTEVKANTPSDPFLTFHFQNKSLSIWHDQADEVEFVIEADIVGEGKYKTYKTLKVAAGEVQNIEIPDSFNPKWIRVISKKDCVATAYFTFN